MLLLRKTTGYLGVRWTLRAEELEDRLLETERLIIRKFFPGDWEDLHEYLSLAETYEFEPGRPLNAEESKALCLERTTSSSFFAVIQKANRKMVGHLYLGQTGPAEYLTWELGYIFNPTYRNNGFCSEASKSIVEFAFAKLKAHRVEAFCNPLNVASWRVLEKVGLKKEGYFREKAFFKRDDNQYPIWHDCLAYGILNAEFWQPETEK